MDSREAIQVGEYQLSIADDKKSVYISHKGGEAGSFNIIEFEKLIAQYFSDNF